MDLIEISKPCKNAGPLFISTSWSDDEADDADSPVSSWSQANFDSPKPMNITPKNNNDQMLNASREDPVHIQQNPDMWTQQYFKKWVESYRISGTQLKRIFIKPMTLNSISMNEFVQNRCRHEILPKIRFSQHALERIDGYINKPSQNKRLGVEFYECEARLVLAVPQWIQGVAFDIVEIGFNHCNEWNKVAITFDLLKEFPEFYIGKAQTPRYLLLCFATDGGFKTCFITSEKRGKPKSKQGKKFNYIQAEDFIKKQTQDLYFIR